MKQTKPKKTRTQKRRARTARKGKYYPVASPRPRQSKEEKDIADLFSFLGSFVKGLAALGASIQAAKAGQKQPLPLKDGKDIEAEWKWVN